MTHHDDLDRDLTAWLADDAVRRVPDGLFDGIVLETRTRRQQPGWLVALGGESMGLQVFRGVGARRIALIVALAALVVLVAMLIAGRQPPTQFHTGLLAFIRDGDVYLANGDGSNARIALREDGVAFSTVAWSPDGERLAIDGDSGVVVLQVATGTATFVGGGNPAWSPDGRQLAVLDPPIDAAPVLRILDATSLSVVRSYRFQAFSGLAWSPNGRWIAATGGDASKAVMRIDLATGEVIQIDPPSGHLDAERRVRWSPDSLRVAFVRYGAPSGPRCGDILLCRVDVYVADNDGSNPVRVNAASGQADMPAWSPDGRWLAFRATEPGSDHREGTGIHVVRPDGTDERTVVSAPVQAFLWSPEGDHLQFTVGRTIWEGSLTGEHHSLGVSIDEEATPFEGTGFGFALQLIDRDVAVASLPRIEPAAPNPTPEIVSPAPAEPADVSAVWPVLASDEVVGCDPVMFRIASAERTLVAHLCEEAQARSASWSPTGRAYALISGADFGPQGLVIVRPDGAIAFELQLTAGSGLVWAPDGSQLGFVVDGDVWVVQRGGDGGWALVKIEVGGAIDLVWSPDSRRIAVAKGDGTLLIGEPDGSDLQPIGSYQWPVRWAPDGSRLAFVRDGDVWLVNVDGTESQNLTALPFGGAWNASWSPDGSRIAVATPSAILLMAPDGSNRRWLDFGTGGLYDLAWSPDSTRLAVETSEPSNRVLIVSADGSPTVQIDDAGRPGWTPDGQFLLVVSTGTTGYPNGSLAVMHRDGTGRHELFIKASDLWPMVWVRQG